MTDEYLEERLAACNKWLDSEGYYGLPWLKDERNYILEIMALRRLVEQLTDPYPCYYNIDGNCKSHRFVPRPCPHEVAKELLGRG